MEKKNKIIIAVLVIIIIALVAAIGFMFFGDMNQTKSNNTNVTVDIQLVFAVWFKFQIDNDVSDYYCSLS